MKTLELHYPMIQFLIKIVIKAQLALIHEEPLPVNMENPRTGLKIRIFLYCIKKTFLVNYFLFYSFLYFQTFSEFTFCETEESSKYRMIN